MIQDWITLLPFMAGGYLLGALPFGLILCYICGYGDIRAIGSGNIGATNVLRTGNKILAALTLVLDIGKGAGAVYATQYIGGLEPMLAAGLGAVIGHLFPVWLKFKGGKGVATTIGTIIALAPTAGILVCLLWLIIAGLFRMSSLAALISLAASPFAAWIIYAEANMTAVFALIFALVVIKHHSNIARIVSGQEPKISLKRRTTE